MPTQMPISGNPQPPDYWPVCEAYHRVREPMYRAIIADAQLAPDALILDAGCGDAFYAQLIADILGPDARIVAVDRNSAVLRSRINRDPSIQVCLNDLEQAGLKRGVFDVIWSCRAMHSALDPLRRLSALALLLRPRGRLIVIENDLAHYPILSWPADFERRVREAQYRLLSSRSPDGASIERYHAARHLPAWLSQIGLRPVSMRTYVVEDVAPLASEVEAYWKLSMDYLGSLIQPFLSDEDRLVYSRVFDPESPNYLLRHPGFYAMEWMAVACGAAP